MVDRPSLRISKVQHYDYVNDSENFGYVYATIPRRHHPLVYTSLRMLSEGSRTGDGPQALISLVD